MYCNVYNKYRNSYIYIIHLKETLSLSIVYSKCGHEYEEKYLKKKNQLKYSKFLA